MCDLLCTQVSEWTYAVISRLDLAEVVEELEVMLLEDAVANAKFVAKEQGVRCNVYKLVQTHTFPGRPK